MSVCIIYLYSVFVLCVFFHLLLFLFSSIILLAYFPYVSMHAPLCATSSLAICLEGSIFGGAYIFEGTCLFMKAPSLLLPPSSFLFFPSSKT